MKNIISIILVVVIISLSVITSTAVTDLDQMESKTERIHFLGFLGSSC